MNYIGDVIDNLEYLKERLSDERGSDFSGVEALTIAIEIIKMEPVKSEMYFKRKEIEKMIRLNTAFTALENYLDERKLKQIRNYLIDNVFRNPDVMFSKDRDEIDLPEIIASLYEVLHKTVTGEPYEYMYHWANKIGSYVKDDLFTKEENYDSTGTL